MITLAISRLYYQWFLSYSTFNLRVAATPPAEHTGENYPAEIGLRVDKGPFVRGPYKREPLDLTRDPSCRLKGTHFTGVPSA